MSNNTENGKSGSKNNFEKKPSNVGGYTNPEEKIDFELGKGPGCSTCTPSQSEQYIAFALLVIGLLLMLFFHPLIGGLLVGLVVGYFFAHEIIFYLRNLKKITEGHNQVQNIILAGVLLAILIAAPGIVLGAIVVAVFKYVLSGQ